MGGNGKLGRATWAKARRVDRDTDASIFLISRIAFMYLKLSVILNFLAYLCINVYLDIW